MSSVITKSARELNESMIKFFPELNSEYARFPMSYERWLNPGEKTPKGDPCFIKGGDGSIFKKDYVWYSMQPGTCGIACSAADRKAMDEHDDVKRLLYGRHMSPRPSDVAAEKRAMDESLGMARAAYAMENPGIPNPNHFSR